MTPYNYVKSYRKRWNLSQAELGFILGYGNNSAVSRIETGKQQPTLDEMIFLELLFGKGGSRLFPEIYEEHTNQLTNRLALFEENLCEAEANSETLEKLDSIRKLRNALVAANKMRI